MPIINHVNTIPSTGKEVRGLTVMDDLFVLRQGVKHIGVYDVNTYALKRNMETSSYYYSLQNHSVIGISSCSANKCLYVVSNDCNAVLCINPTSGAMPNRWSIANPPDGISVNPVSKNVVVTCLNVHNLYEYTPAGVLVRTVSLQAQAAGPRHAIQLTSGQLLVCHGDANAFSRVCLLEEDGQKVVNFAGSW